MKFVSSKKLTDYAQRLHKARTEREALRQKLKTLEAEIESLEVFIQARRPEGFRFADPNGYLMEARIEHDSRAIVDLARVRRDYARWGQEVPMKRPRWSHVVTGYVLEALES